MVEGSGDVRWFGTSGGLSRWDGVRWTHWDHKVGISGFSVFALAIDKSGRVWFSDRSNGLGYFENDSVGFITEADGLLDDRVWEIALDPSDSSLWIATSGGLSRLVDGRWAHFRTAEGIPSPFLCPFW